MQTIKSNSTLFLSFALLILSLTFSCNSNEKHIHELISASKTSLKNKNYSNALKQIDSVLRLDSLNYEAWLVKGKIHDRIENHELALEAYFKAKSLNKNDTLYSLIGKTYFSSASPEMGASGTIGNKYFKAVQYLDSSLIYNSNLYDSWVLKTKSLHNSENHKDALATVNRAILIFPDSIELQLIRGIEKGFVGDKKGSIEDLSKLIERDEFSDLQKAMAYRFRGITYGEIGYNDKAKRDYTSSIELDKEEYGAYLNRGIISLEENKLDDACQDFRKAADLGLTDAFEYIETYCQ